MRSSWWALATVSIILGPSLAQAQEPLTVRDALLAQVDGLGGCFGRMPLVTPLQIRFFPDVSFYVGTCVLEHGDTAHPIAALDRDQLTYVLDSKSAFRLLIRRHHAIGVDSATAVEYAKIALAMSGDVPYEAVVALHVTDLPPALCKHLSKGCSGFFESRVDRRMVHSGLIAVLLTAYTKTAIFSAGPVVIEPDGSVIGAIQEYH